MTASAKRRAAGVTTSLPAGDASAAEGFEDGELAATLLLARCISFDGSKVAMLARSRSMPAPVREETM